MSNFEITRRKRKFYIIGHYCNTVKEAMANLIEGANAIGPDVNYIEDSEEKFYVYHAPALNPQELSLKQYLQDMITALQQPNAPKLDLIVFDLKSPYTYDINDLYKVIRENFSTIMPQVKIVTSIADPEYMNFLAALENQQPNEAVGVDEYSKCRIVDNFFKNKGLRYAYGNGSSSPFTPTTRFALDIAKAVRIRNRGNSFSMVYPWTVNAEFSMMTYLRIGVDGMITDKPAKLRKLLQRKWYQKKYEI